MNHVGKALRRKACAHAVQAAVRDRIKGASGVDLFGALFLKRKYFESFGLFDLKYKKVMDYELYLRAKSSIQIVNVERIVAKVLAGGVSQQDFPQLIKEFKEISRLHTSVPHFYLDLYYFVKIIKFRIRSFIFKLKSSK